MSRPVPEGKLNRKRSKYAAILLRLYDAVPAETPGPVLMVCNAGLSLGLGEEQLLSLFGPYGRVRALQMVAKESHAFVEFWDAADAERCFTQCNGLRLVPETKGPLYLLYLDRVPKVAESEVYRAPPGCRLFEEFVSEAEEEELLASVRSALAEGGGDLKQRRVAHFGYEFLYESNNVDKERPMSRQLPTSCAQLKSRLAERGLPLDWEPDQLTVNEYQPGQGIPPHVDTHSAFEDPILSLSLSSTCVMDFRRGSDRWSVFLPRRSLLVMGGESRLGWTHGIAGRHSDVTPDQNGTLTVQERGTRVSFTFRRVRRASACSCSFKQLCDSQQLSAHVPSAALEGQYVHEVYEGISDHFSQTRHKPWPAVLKLVQSLPAGSIVLDVGCGNCKYFGFGSSVYEIGADHSAGLLGISRERGFQSVRVNCLSLPFRDSSVDCVLCIAVIHHLASEERRRASVAEILRVLAPTGQALIYVWAKDQRYRGRASNYLSRPPTSTEEVNHRGDVLPVHVNRTDFAHGQSDLLVPWKLKSGPPSSPSTPAATYLRYYHVFDEFELEGLVAEAGGALVDSYYDNGNWCCLIAKRAL